jgi:hypothetical protein
MLVQYLLSCGHGRQTVGDTAGDKPIPELLKIGKEVANFGES